ncbi:hypothetical protein [Flavihumibacter sp. ZG627]|uniref:hypothetical protein n=1 Tax=Flavihumibacter sp. ZG627 TaxID=1463156 RepID=UPI0005801A87|nr:hypothetical protein [Flavihumibacter sp. ZG627]KIC90005.1 hypothetical protein HY58_13425 [Flavihumibacter sp. ZG627]
MYTITDIIQAAAAIIALIWAGFTYFNSKKIDELVDINKELAKQTVIFEQDLQLQRSLTIQDRIPYFIRGGFAKGEQELYHTMNFSNIGQTATNISYKFPQGYSEKIKHQKNCEKQSKLTISLTVPKELFLENYQVKINYENILGLPITQIVSVFPAENRAEIERPQDILSLKNT